MFIVLDGTYGFGTSFLEESFGGLIREDGIDLDDFVTRVDFVSEEETFLIEEIKRYMKDADERKKSNETSS